MHTLLPRMAAAVATAFVTWFVLWLDTHFKVHVSPAEQDALTAGGVAIMISVYAYVHRYISQRLNPEDLAKKPNADGTITPKASMLPNNG